MMEKKPQMNADGHRSSKTTENTEVSFDGLIGLFEQTQANMQNQAARSVDIALVVRNWLFGWYIVEYQQSGFDRAEYGKKLLKRLSKELTEKIGKGFSVDNLELMRKFYAGYAEIKQAISLTCLPLSISETPSRISAGNSETLSRKTDIFGISGFAGKIRIFRT